MTMTQTAAASIDIRQATKTYGSFTAMKAVDLHVDAGEFITLLGPSGSGKTTTLNAIAGFIDLTSGSLSIGGRAVDGLPAHKRNIGVVFQNYSLFPHMTVERNVMYPLTLRQIAPDQRRRMVGEALEMVRMSEFAHRYPSELSGGQQQRVALARALVFRPPLLLMDEPLGALDKKLREWLQLEIKRLHRELGTTFVFVTHDQEEALVLSDRIAVFNQGRIEQIGTGRDLYDDPQSLFVGQFIGESTLLRGATRHANGQTVLTLAGQNVVAHGASTATPVFFLRPERLDIVAPDAASPHTNRLRATITEAIYLGAGSKYELRLADGCSATVRLGLDRPTWDIGADVDVVFSPQDVKVLDGAGLPAPGKMEEV
jgi:putative spermidine/putrescine transport system ATP-binding protein